MIISRINFLSYSEFHDGTCRDANDIVVNLCQWLETYFDVINKNIVVRQSSQQAQILLFVFISSPWFIVMDILQQISVNNLNWALNSIGDFPDAIKGYIYQQRARYLESINRGK